MFIAFLERKLAEHGVCKLVPGQATLEQHARRMIEQRMTEKLIDDHRREMQNQAALIALPDDLSERVTTLLVQAPELSWDMAVAEIVGRR